MKDTFYFKENEDKVSDGMKFFFYEAITSNKYPHTNFSHILNDFLII